MDNETIILLREIRTLLRLKICQDALTSDDCRIPDLQSIAISELYPEQVLLKRKDWIEPYKTFAETALDDMKTLGLLKDDCDVS